MDGISPRNVEQDALASITPSVFLALYSTIQAQRYSIPASNSDNFFFVLFYHQIPFNFVDFSNLYLLCRMNQKLFLPSALVCFVKFHRISHFVRMKVLPKSIYLLTSRYGMVCARALSRYSLLFIKHAAIFHRRL